ncbi:MAG: DUF2282 domain-containing protein [Leptothrix sp. (in: b-proteobacteria)]
MNHVRIASSAFAAAVALGLVGQAHAMESGKGKEKCYGIAQAGQNDCANLAGTHSCAGQATEASAGEWKYVAKGSCKSMSGLSADEAKLAMAKK